MENLNWHETLAPRDVVKLFGTSLLLGAETEQIDVSQIKPVLSSTTSIGFSVYYWLDESHTLLYQESSSGKNLYKKNDHE